MVRVLICLMASLSLFAAEQAATPTAFEAALIDGNEAEKKGLLGKALEHYAEAQRLEPGKVDGYYYRGRVLTRQRKSEEAIVALTKAVEIEPKASTAFQLRGIEWFRLGEIQKSIDDFDRYLALEPQQAPYHWQRGISLYYAGKYELGKRQFETHQGVNAQDVENAVWHFICAAKVNGFETAREGLITITDDRRVPMAEVFKLFAGKGTEQDVMEAVKRGTPSPAQLADRYCYAHLYLGLYYEAKGDGKKAYEHIKKAATEFAQDHYMGDVAKVHFKLLLKNPPSQ